MCGLEMPTIGEHTQLNKINNNTNIISFIKYTLVTKIQIVNFLDLYEILKQTTTGVFSMKSVNNYLWLEEKHFVSLRIGGALA